LKIAIDVTDGFAVFSEDSLQNHFANFQYISNARARPVGLESPTKNTQCLHFVTVAKLDQNASMTGLLAFN
jgi:hypothetical protein